MKKFYSLFTILIVSIFIISCQDNVKQKELEIKEKELLLKEKELTNIQKNQKVQVTTDTAAIETAQTFQPVVNNDPVSKTKYGFVVFECQIPKLDPVYESYVISSDYMKFGSKVVDIPYYSKDEEYRLLDKGEIEMEQKLAAYKSQLQAEIIQQVRPYEKGDGLMRSAERKYNIIKREAKIYDTYSEASIARKNMGF